MITVHGERGFEQIDSWEEVESLPGFTHALDPRQKELKEIIGRYVFKEKTACGLTNCKQPHSKGYLVVTTTGEVTNIGNVCGKTHFGVSFQEYSKVFTRALNDHQNRESIASFLFAIEDNIAAVAAIRHESTGADWVYRTARSLTLHDRGCPSLIVDKVNSLVKSRSPSIELSRVASEQEAEELEAISGRSLPRPQYIDEALGTLSGIETLYPENDLRQILVLDLQENLFTLSEFDVDSADSKELRLWAKWCSEFDEKFERAQNVVRSGRRLLKADNLLQLAPLLSRKNEVTQFKRWLKQEL